MEKRRYEVRMDRISGMPQPILQQILSPLSQAEAVRTCVLSKSWRHHWCTRPNVEFREESFIGKEQTFESFVNKTLQRYRDQNLSIHEFRLHVSEHDCEPAAASELLRKWIPTLKIFNMYLLREGYSRNFDIPLPVFEAESLQKLYLERCTLNQECVAANVLFKHLKTLHLIKVNIEDETLKKIFSTCPLLESVTLDYCFGLRTAIKVDDKLHHNLKHFEFDIYLFGFTPTIEIHVLSAVIERIKISRCGIWFYNNKRNLKSLSLTRVRLSSEMLDLFSWNNMPSLEFLELVSCYGFKEFHLSSRSIKHLSFEFECLRMVEPVIRFTIDAPNIVCFKYSSYFLPSVFSFTTTNSCTHEWKSKVKLYFYDSLRFLKLYELLKELSGSKISLKLSKTLLANRKIFGDVVSQDEPYGDKKPVVVEYLKLWLHHLSMDFRSAFLNELLDICRPRILVHAQNTGDFLSELFEINGHWKLMGTGFGGGKQGDLWHRGALL